jgi:hypothetical protein
VIHRFLCILILAAAFELTGCRSPEQAAYRATGSVALAVDAAMRGWGDYVRAGLATPQQEATVKGAYERYQATMRLARRLVESYGAGETDRLTLDTTFSAVDNAKNELVDLIQTFRRAPATSTH